MSQLTLAELERHLWGAADLLRGSIDSGDFKHYIFGLLFYKRLCDVWEEEYEALLAEFDGDTEVAVDPDEHRFHIPEDCRWSDIRKVSVDIGTQLNMGFRAIEDANPRLKGVFQDVDFANKERFPDQLLESLLQHFDKYRMRKADVPSTVLGDAYEYLIAKFADDAGKKGGEF
jgi:type I restriction enzyme M protein